MTTDTSPFDIAKRAFGLAEAGHWQAAADLYADAVSRLPEKHYYSSIVHGEYAAVLTKLEDHAKARGQYERVLELELRDSADEASSGIAVARYLLGEHFLRTNDPDAALRTVEPTIVAQARAVRLAYMVAADALRLLGRDEEARAAARLALRHADTDTQRTSIRQRLAELLSEHS